jgi:hypothetical protein
MEERVETASLRLLTDFGVGERRVVFDCQSGQLGLVAHSS